ncbi:OsmC family protein [Lentilactobacillus hilgardii]
MMDPRWHQALYRTEGINSEGLEGHAYVPDGLNVKTSSPLNNHPGTNPEQLLSLSLSTCLEATLEAIERERQLPHISEVRVQVAFIGARAHYEFLVNAQIKVASVDFETAKSMTAEAERRCCVSQLLAGSKNYTVETVKEFSQSK